MRRRGTAWGILGLLTGLAVTPARADLRWQDPFDGDSLATAWQVGTSGVAAWSGGVADGRYTMDQMSSAVSYSWCEVNLHRSLGCLDDFVITVDAGWESSSLQAIQELFIEVRGPEGQSLAMGGHDDAWFGQRGSLLAHVDGEYWYSGAGTQPYFAPLQVLFVREGGQGRVLLDGVERASQPLADPASSLWLRFRHYRYANASVFGDYWVDHVRVEAPFHTELKPLQDGSLWFRWDACLDRPIRLYGAPSMAATWPEDYQLLLELPAGTTETVLPAPVGDGLSVFRATRVLD